MGITQYYVASSIDGFIADEADRLDWLLQFGFDLYQARYDEFYAEVGAIVMGSSTYEYLLREGEWGYSLPVWVLTSRELPVAPGADIRFHSGDVGEVAAEAAAGDRNVWLMGGGKVAAQFAERGLLDELLLTVVPVLIGSGKSLLPLTRPTAPVTLTGTTTFENGSIELRYQLAPVV
ncbi:dihydrofolate reductase family protein [Diaminobutyricimonas sp. LJ205]|uniref:dihydrofolate reductase family protein n=1 Tax=Diaminobutyricimonas sp. LJ205 TaxID=2683590 RepID=UPI0012F48986|nr:dihydrofolate reductase family protein [Diaminobutyricimonas sp. LJ205]